MTERIAMASRKRPEYADVANKEPTYKHTAFADWLSEATGYDVDVKSVQLAQSLANVYRGTDAYLAAEEAQVSRREQAKADKKKAAAQRVIDRAEKLAAQAAELRAKAAEISPVDEVGARRARKAPAKKAAPAKAAPAKKAAPPAPPAPPAKKAASKRAARKAASPVAPIDPAAINNDTATVVNDFDDEF